ncbi:MAG: MBL fold metallo-hydrolase [Synergistaceae bacterium]|jgi:glyoxylase-like metal-dependent hydrolase (beta-lactamase superfamily II)|nr:MBL fold metallo-hydrolase [Synergistaceae bacterium]
MGYGDKSAEILILTVNYGDGKNRPIHPVIISDGRERVLIDCGYPGQLADLESAAELSGVPLSQLTAVIITHHDHDHYGSLLDIREKYPSVEVMASELDAPYIDGTRRSLRLEQTDIMDIDGMDEFRRAVAAVKPAPVDITLRGGDVFPWCGGTEIIPTPGHMPGHISVYVRQRKVLITGDALIAIGGRPRISNPHYAIDALLAKSSVEKLAEYDIDTFICYHGGLARANPLHSRR